jgi:hypothetical protein
LGRIRCIGFVATRCGLLKSIGIEKGKQFTPDAAIQRILKAGAQEAQPQFIEELTSCSQPWWPDRSWSPPDARGVKTGFTYQTADALEIDARGWANFPAFPLPKKTRESVVYCDIQGGPFGSAPDLVGKTQAPGARSRALEQLNQGGGRHSVPRVVFTSERGELRQRYRQGQGDQLGALRWSSI